MTAIPSSSQYDTHSSQARNGCISIWFGIHTDTNTINSSWVSVVEKLIITYWHVARSGLFEVFQVTCIEIGNSNRPTPGIRLLNKY